MLAAFPSLQNFHFCDYGDLLLADDLLGDAHLAHSGRGVLPVLRNFYGFKQGLSFVAKMESCRWCCQQERAV